MLLFSYRNRQGELVAIYCLGSLKVLSKAGMFRGENEELNAESKTICYQEFGSVDLSDIQKLRILIRKRFYAVPYIDSKDGEEYYDMVIE